MSFGRSPFYIYECACRGVEESHPASRHVVFGSKAIPWDALAQFVATLAARDDLGEYVARGKELRADVLRPELTVTVTGAGWRN